MSGAKTSVEGAEEREALEAAWPRILIANGRAPALAAWWVRSRQRAEARGLPRIARHPLDSSVEAGLFDARRARRLERGLEGAETRLAAEEAGLKKTAAAGSERFYRQVESLRVRFANRLEVLLLDCDEHALGAAAFGPGRRARALLIHHKEAVVRFLSILDVDPGDSAREISTPD